MRDLERNCYLGFESTILVLREELLGSLYCVNFRTLISHDSRFLEQKSRALHPAVI
jgi:hypothetical protein